MKRERESEREGRFFNLQSWMPAVLSCYVLSLADLAAGAITASENN